MKINLKKWLGKSSFILCPNFVTGSFCTIAFFSKLTASSTKPGIDSDFLTFTLLSLALNPSNIYTREEK